MKKFNIPAHYQSPIISKIKAVRKAQDLRKSDFTPSKLDFGPIKFIIARHFGFCYGVENAIEIVYKTIEENPGKSIYLLSEMIHNPSVNQDLLDMGIKFIKDTADNQLIEWNAINGDDIVLIPAFGTTLEIEKILQEKGIEIKEYNTTCPFVERVWKRSASLGKEDYSVVIHGKSSHEETRATFSHSNENAPSVIIQNIGEAIILGEIILGERNVNDFYTVFENRYSQHFNPKTDLDRIGVINQTTMLASDTQEIAEYLKSTLEKKYGLENSKNHFADTRDTLCYATTDNQTSVKELLQASSDLAIVIGGYNSSNTTHLVELCDEKTPTYFISSAKKIISKNTISHFDIHQNKEVETEDFLPNKTPITIAITSGASCPDKLVDEVIQKLVSYFKDSNDLDKVLTSFQDSLN